MAADWAPHAPGSRTLIALTIAVLALLLVTLVVSWLIVRQPDLTPVPVPSASL